MIHSLVSLQGRGGGRVPQDGESSIALSSYEVRTIIAGVAAELFPARGYSSALLRLAHHPDAPRLIAERTAAYVAARSAAAPAAPPNGGSGPKRPMVV